MQTTLYSRKPLMVEAIQVTEANTYEVAEWCGGEVYVAVNGKKTIQVKVLHPLHSKQTKAQAGDWVLKSTQGYKIYADSAFRKGFELFKEDDEKMADVGQLLRNQLGNTPTTELQFVTPAPMETEKVLPPAMEPSRGGE